MLLLCSVVLSYKILLNDLVFIFIFNFIHLTFVLQFGKIIYKIKVEYSLTALNSSTDCKSNLLYLTKDGLQDRLTSLQPTMIHILRYQSCLLTLSIKKLQILDRKSFFIMLAVIQLCYYNKRV